jgi:hypothetical protein
LTKKLEITIQTSQLLIVRGGRSTRAWCEPCGAEMEVLTEETARLLLRASSDRMLGALPGGLHLALSSDGTSGVCLKSLLQVVGNSCAFLGPGTAMKVTRKDEDKEN